MHPTSNKISRSASLLQDYPLHLFQTSPLQTFHLIWIHNETTYFVLTNPNVCDFFLFPFRSGSIALYSSSTPSLRKRLPLHGKSATGQHGSGWRKPDWRHHRHHIRNTSVTSIHGRHNNQRRPTQRPDTAGKRLRQLLGAQYHVDQADSAKVTQIWCDPGLHVRPQIQLRKPVCLSQTLGVWPGADVSFLSALLLLRVLCQATHENMQETRCYGCWYGNHGARGPPCINVRAATVRKTRCIA